MTARRLPRGWGVLSTWRCAHRAQRRSWSCSRACRSSRRWRPGTSNASRNWRCRAASRPARRCSARGTGATPVTSCTRVARARCASTARRTITLATFGRGDIFGELALFEDEHRSATVETLGPMSAVAVLGPDMRRLMASTPRSRCACWSRWAGACGRPTSASRAAPSRRYRAAWPRR